jgi:hypothetical protein
MGEFVSFLLQLSRDVYTPDDLQAAMAHVRSCYPGVITFWEYGDA